MKNNWLKNNKSNDISYCGLEECTAVIDLRAENEQYRKALEEVEKYCNECNLKADYTACEVLKIIDEVLK